MVAAHRRGYRIREFTTSEIHEVAAVREQLEVLVARTLAASRTPEDLDRLGDILRRQDEDTEAKCIFALDEEFHLTSAELAGLHRTRDLLAGLRSVRAAIIAGVVVPPELSALRVAEHHQILAAIAAGDRREAVRLMRAHVRASEQTFLDALQAATATGPMIKPLNRGASPGARG
jgi:DNA-binding GntR family transcriptional regulator